MKVRNCKTGEIGELRYAADDDGITVKAEDGVEYLYKSLIDVCKFWEDLNDPETPKGYWYIDTSIGEIMYGKFCYGHRYLYNKKIGNCFDTQNDAFNAKYKLEAFERTRKKIHDEV